MVAAFLPVNLSEFAHGLNRSINIWHNESHDSVANDLWNRTAGISNHRGPASHSFYHYDAERFRPVDRKQKRSCIAKKRSLIVVADLAHEFHRWIIQHSTNDTVEVGLVGAINFRGDL